MPCVLWAHASGERCSRIEPGSLERTSKGWVTDFWGSSGGSRAGGGHVVGVQSPSFVSWARRVTSCPILPGPEQGFLGHGSFCLKTRRTFWASQRELVNPMYILTSLCFSFLICKRMLLTFRTFVKALWGLHHLHAGWGWWLLLVVWNWGQEWGNLEIKETRGLFEAPCDVYVESLSQPLSLKRLVTTIHSTNIDAPPMTKYHARHWNKAMYYWDILPSFPGPKSNGEERIY